jgi:magnesium chelatase subunit H
MERAAHCTARGKLESYNGLSTVPGKGSFVAGLRVGNVFIGVQPALGVEGDPMRLLFERDLTPHPQYAAYYKYLQHGLGADAVVHMGMHGTVEWLPGSPLGNTGLSWSDQLLGGGGDDDTTHSRVSCRAPHTPWRQTLG